MQLRKITKEWTVDKAYKIIIDPGAAPERRRLAWRKIDRTLKQAVIDAAERADDGSERVTPIEFCPYDGAVIYTTSPTSPHNSCRMGEEMLGMTCLAHIGPGVLGRPAAIKAEAREAGCMLEKFLKLLDPQWHAAR